MTSVSFSAAALHCQGLHVRYDREDVLDAVDLAVAPGTCTALLGPSGCGKTTLLRAVAGLVRSHRGTIHVGGRVVEAGGASRVPVERRGVALVFQNQALWPHMTVAGNLDFVLDARGVKGDERRAEAARATQAVGLPERLHDRRPGELSGGERQRAALARALVQRPEVLLLDEPLTGLDRHLRGHLLATLRDLRRASGLSMLIATHDQEEAFALADRVIVLRGGRVEQEGTAVEVYGAPASRFVAQFVGSASCLAAERDGTRFRTSLGSWPVPETGALPSGPLLAVFRPEGVRVDDGAAARGKVVDSYYRGGHWVHLVELDADGARVQVRAAGPRAPDAPIGLSADRPALVAADEDGRSPS